MRRKPVSNSAFDVLMWAAVIVLIGLGVALLVWLFCLLMCGAWNHIVVVAFPNLHRITMFQAFAVYAVLWIIASFFRGSSSSKKE